MTSIQRFSPTSAISPSLPETTEKPVRPMAPVRDNSTLKKFANDANSGTALRARFQALKESEENTMLSAQGKMAELPNDPKLAHDQHDEKRPRLTQRSSSLSISQTNAEIPEAEVLLPATPSGTHAMPSGETATHDPGKSHTLETIQEKTAPQAGPVPVVGPAAEKAGHTVTPAAAGLASAPAPTETGQAGPAARKKAAPTLKAAVELTYNENRSMASYPKEVMFNKGKGGDFSMSSFTHHPGNATLQYGKFAASTFKGKVDQEITLSRHRYEVESGHPIDKGMIKQALQKDKLVFLEANLGAVNPDKKDLWPYDTELFENTTAKVVMFCGGDYPAIKEKMKELKEILGDRLLSTVPVDHGDMKLNKFLDAKFSAAMMKETDPAKTAI